MDTSKKKKNCPYCLTMRCCLDHCCDWDSCQCKDCILCGGVLDNEYTKEEKDQLQKAFRALEIIAENKNLLDSGKKPAESTKKVESKPEEKPQKIEGSLSKTEEKDSKNFESESDRVKRLVDETTRKTNETLASIERTLASLKKTQDECRATDQRFQDFQQKFQTTMDAFSLKLAEGLESSGLLGPAHKAGGCNSEKIYHPSISDVESVAELLITKTKIILLTGAGISVASGIPTFRGKGGLWTSKNSSLLEETIQAKDFLTYSYFKEKPEEVWDWHFEFKRMVRLSSPNVCHSVVAELQQFCEENDIECALITQNIDNFHVESYCKLKSFLYSQSTSDSGEESKMEIMVPHLFPQDSLSYGFIDNIFEIHGNINYMRCDQSCTPRLFPSPEVPLSSLSQGQIPIPKCPVCKGLARPHTLFFDESYNEEFYKKDSAMASLENMDCLIVVGTRLETNLASRIVGEAISKDCLIVEINPEPVIECGNVLQLIGESEKIIPNLWKMTRVKFFEFHEAKDGKRK